jgi:hypothetical protein
LMKQEVLSDEKIGQFVEVFRKAIDETEDEWLKNKLQWSIELLKHIQTLEAESQLEDEKELVKLESMLECL